MPQSKMSKSPYINYLIDKNMNDLRQDPQKYVQIQNKIMSDLSSIDTSALQDVNPEEELSEEAKNQAKNVLAIITNRITLTVRDKSYAEFFESQPHNALYFKVVLPADKVLQNFLDNQCQAFGDKPEVAALLDKFILNFSSKFKERVLMTDDVEPLPQIAYGRMTLLEGGDAVVTETQVVQKSPLSSIVYDLILQDKSLYRQFGKLLAHEVPEHKEVMTSFMMESLKTTVAKINSEQTLVGERSMKNLELHMKYSTYYRIEGGVETYIDFAQLKSELEQIQFNPEQDQQNIRRKLGI